MKKEIRSAGAPNPVGPYSQAIIADNFIFCSGQIAINPISGEIEGKEITEQTKQVFLNLESVLKEAELTFDDLVQTNVYLKNMDDFKNFNEVYSGFFKKDPKPARQTVEVSRLPKDALVEVSCVAYKDKK